MAGLLILAVIYIWLEANRKEREAQTRRDEREKREEARSEKFIAAIEQVNRSIVESQAKCGMNQYLLDQLKRRDP